MKAIMAVDSLAPELTGIGRYTWELVRGLGQHPAIDQLRCYRNGRWVLDPSTLLRPAQEPVSSAPAKRRGWSLRVPRSWREIAMRAACRGDIFHGPNFFLPPCADIGVITVHDLSVLKFPQTHPVERIREFERQFERSIAQAAHVITPTETVKAEVMAFCGLSADRVTAVYEAAGSEFFPQAPDALVPVLSPLGLRPGAYGLCVSTLEPRKQIGPLIQAYERLPPALRTQYPLALAGGKGWLNEELHQQIERGRAQGWLYPLGYVPEAHLAALYAGARGFFYPSAYEGFGLPPLEAMSCGIPTLVSNQSCLPEVTRGAALQVDPADADAFLAGVQTVLADEGWREKLKSEGLRVSASYSWQQCVDQTVAVYQRALRQG